MKSLLLTTFVMSSLATSPAFAAVATLSLQARKALIQGDGTQATLIDITKELKKLGTSPDKAHLLKVDLKVKGASAGSTFGLMINGVAVDSAVVTNDDDQDLTLTADSISTPAPWILGVRGGAEIKSFQVTVDGVVQTPQVQPTAPTNISPKAPTKTASDSSTSTSSDSSPSDLAIGQQVMITSRSSGQIDYATIAQRKADGKFVVNYGGKLYSGFRREQLGLLQGCGDGGFCVGDRVVLNSRSWETLSVVARLPGNSYVLEGSSGERSVTTSDQMSKDSAVSSNGSQVAPNAKPLTGRFTRGQVVLMLDEASHTHGATIVQMDQVSLTLEPLDGGAQVRVTDSSKVGVLEGCAGNFCVGDRATAVDRSGVSHRAEVLAIQSPTTVVIRMDDYYDDLGNWPVRSLSPLRSQGR